MARTCGIYIIAVTNGDGLRRYYVGQSVDIERRFRKHRNELRRGSHHNSIMQRLWNKHGEQAFRFAIVEACPPDKLDESEDWWLQEMIGQPHCINIGTTAVAPMRGATFSDEHRARMRASAKRGEHHHLYGKKMPDETRRKLSEAQSGRKVSDETKRRQSAAMKIRAPWRGKFGAESPTSKPVIGVPVAGGEELHFDSAASAGRNGFNKDNICMVCKGKRKSHRGYVWKYAKSLPAE